MFDDELATELAAEPELALLCGRYEGVDERVRDHLVTDAVSIGRYVLAGGELAAMVVADAVLRKLPGALGHADSALEESFSTALEGDPEYPHYTRPPTYRGLGHPRGARLGRPRAGSRMARASASRRAGRGGRRARQPLATIRGPRGRTPAAASDPTGRRTSRCAAAGASPGPSRP